MQWARQGRSARIRLLTGPGGVGKSRLAAEVAEVLRAEGWTAGFIRPSDPIVVPLRRSGLLLIVDYPEEHPDEVQTLLRDVALRELRDVPVRLLVLSRQGGDRWFDLLESAHAGELMDAQEISLSELAAEEIELVFSESLRRLAEHYGRPIPVIPSEALRSWVALDPALHGLPLFLTAAAVHAFLSPGTALGITGTSVVKALTDREWARLANTGRVAGLPEGRSAARIVALASVAGSLDAVALRRLADPLLEIGLPAPDRVVDAVNSLPSWQNHRVTPPEPDLMAAALLIKALSERPDKASDWLWAVMELDIGSQLTDRLSRLAFDTMTITGSTISVTQYLSHIVRNDLSRAQKLDLLAYGDLPFGLEHLAEDVIRMLLTTTTDEAERASYLNNLSICLRAANDGAGALAAIREAVEILFPLAESDVSRFAPDLARGFHNLSIDLRDAGDNAGALAAIRDAVEIRRIFARNNPHFADELASSLNALSSQLSDAGDASGALAAIREAVEIRRVLAQDEPSRFAPDLASSLNNLALRLRDAGDSAGALAAIREATDAYRRLAQVNPPRFVLDLAICLNTLSLIDVDDHNVALAAVREAVAILRPLAQNDPARFAPDLAISLNNLSNRLSGAGDRAGALAAIREVVEIRRRLAQDNPARFTRDLAVSLYNLSNCLSETGADLST